MNKKILIIIAVVVSMLIASLIFFLSSIRDTATVEVSLKSQRMSAKAALTQLTEGIREDLIQGNIRLARNVLEAVKNDRLFSAYQIIQNNRLVEETEDFNQKLTSKNYVSIPVTIKFGAEGASWGTVDYLVSLDQSKQLLGSLRSHLLMASAISGGATLLLVLTLFYFIWYSSTVLSRTLESLLNNKAISSSRVLTYLWQPTLSSFAEIATRNNELKNIIHEAQTKDALVKITEQVAHDIRSPLSVLRLVLSDPETFNGEKSDIAAAAVKRLDLIAASLLERSKKNILTSSTSKELSLAAQEAVRDAKIRFPDRVFTLQQRLNSDAAKYLTNQTDFYRVISNMLTNAFEATKTGGKIKVLLIEAPNGLRLMVADNGDGIPSESINSLGVNRFTSGKLESSSSGTGLGLGYVRECTMAWNGQLRIRSKLGRGTALLIVIPKSV